MSIPKWNLIWINNRYPAFFQPSKFLPVLFSYYQISNHKNIIPTYTKCYWSSIDAKSRFPYTINEVLTTWKLSISWWCNNPKPTCLTEKKIKTKFAHFWRQKKITKQGDSQILQDILLTYINLYIFLENFSLPEKFPFALEVLSFIFKHLYFYLLFISWVIWIYE